MTANTPSVIVDRVTVRYLTPSQSAGARAQASPAQRVVARLLGRNVRVPIYPVDDVSFVAYRGENIGILGENGAGKSTLLRIIGGFEKPYHGQVYASDQPALLGVNAALIPDLTGRRNARLGCLAMGLSPERTDELVPQIIDFSGIGEAADRAMKTYSSGMQARLRFAISAAIRPEILLIDEALGTGDAAFAARAGAAMEETRKAAGTIFTVSHAAQTIEETCTRALWLHRGALVGDGPAPEIARAYRWWAWNKAQGKEDVAAELLRKQIESFQQSGASRRRTPRHLR
ncbi:MAG: ABC transporter ATP-binding protein [Ancrocorticia sp.]